MLRMLCAFSLLAQTFVAHGAERKRAPQPQGQPQPSQPQPVYPQYRPVPAPAPAPVPAYPVPVYPQPYPPPVYVHPVAPLAPTPEPPLFRGYTNYFYQLGIGYKQVQLTRRDPEQANKLQNDAPVHSLIDSALIGWGPVRFDDVTFSVHYQYSQDWGTTYDQVVDRFLKKWFSDPSASTFVFPTSSMIRTHEIVSDLRYVTPLVHLGIFSRVGSGYVGSNFLGDETIVEKRQKLFAFENFVPYMLFRYGKIYQLELSMPFRTEINHEDELQSFKTYDFKLRGRGRVFSGDLRNRIYFPSMASYLFLNLFMYDLKYNSIQQDRTRFGMNLSLDVPVVSGLRATPRYSFSRDEFFLPRIRPDENEIEKKRVDNFNSYGLGAYFDFNKRHRLRSDFVLEPTDSTITEHRTNRTVFVLSYAYSFPSTTLVLRRAQRFGDDAFLEEF